MKKLIFLYVVLCLRCFAYGQETTGKVIVERINAPSIQNNPGGEDPVRRVTIYLPPGYSETTNRYPVIYYLHGITWSDSLAIAFDHLDQVFDKAILSGKIGPVIVVLPNHYTTYRGSMYTNSSLTGNWADFTANDLVKHIDKNYRTIPDRDSRGITGHSMGGHGALKLGMLYPETFSSVYALSPAILGLAKEFGPMSGAFRRAEKIKTREELFKDFLANVVVVLGRTFSPNPSKPPFYCDLPFTYQGDSLIIDYAVLALWQKNLPIEMLNDHTNNLKRLKALALDWGRNEESPHIPLTCQIFSQKLENLGISHYAEEYIGTHGNKLWTEDGRALNDMLPFFNRYLKFEPIKYKNPEKKKTSKGN